MCAATVRRKRLGLIINPIAGMGGPVALKGTDGASLDEARRRGAVESAGSRAALALGVLAPDRGSFDVLTASGAMGERAARAGGFSPVVLHSASPAGTSAEDTRAAARNMAADGADLILFAGGDGTARDLYEEVGSSVPLLGIPAGVKMHSGVFATNPRNAGRLAAEFIGAPEPARLLRDAEIMDREEGASGGSARLFGYARTPHLPKLRQAAKASPPTDEVAEIQALCRELAALAQDHRTTIVGPGTTTRTLKQHLGAEGTLLGVDAFRGGALLAADVTEAELFELVREHPARIVVGIVGGQGYLFGRGNQQISPRVIAAVGRPNIIVVSTTAKLLSLPENALLVDTGDDATDFVLAGYIQVLTGPGRRTMFRVAGT